MEYTSTAGTEKEEDGIHPMEQPASIPLSHGEKKKIFIDFSLCFCLLLCLSRCFSVILPANHLRVVVDRNVGSHAVVVGAKVTVWCTKPFVKAILQGQVLWSVAQMPKVTKKKRCFVCFF